MLDLRRLRLLRELDARGTVHGAARALDYTPSAVSQQLAVLEREAGAKLLERSGRNVRLTDAGRVLVRHAGTLLDGMEAAEAEVAEVAAGRPAGVVRVSAFQSAFLRIVAPAIAALAESHPDVRVEATEVEVEEGVPALRLQQLDAVIGDEYDGPAAPGPRRPAPRAAGARAGAARHAGDPPARAAAPRADGPARRRRVGGVPAGHRPPRDADPRLPAARRLRARPAVRVRRLPDPARARAHHRRLRAAARPGARLRHAGRGRAPARRGGDRAARCSCSRAATRTPAVEAVAAALKAAAP